MPTVKINTTKRMYIDNEKFLKLIKEYKRQTEPKIISEELGEMFKLIADNVAYDRKFINYTEEWKNEMKSDALFNCLHRDTKILTLEYGSVCIGDIVGQTVSVKSRDGVWRPAFVRSFGRQKLFKFWFGSRNKQLDNLFDYVIATKNHRWFLKSRINKKGLFDKKSCVVEDLRVGDMLESPKDVRERDNDGIIHGIIFGDGTTRRKTQTAAPNIVSTQGSEYVMIRVCKQDKVRDEIVSYLSGYTCSYPISCKGDPIYYLGNKPFLKELPFTTDPYYISGFIYGWWLADGRKCDFDNSARLQISTTDTEAVLWMKENAAIGGFKIVNVRTSNSKECYANAKPLHTIDFSHSELFNARVRKIEPFGEDEVFCVEEPITNGFVLSNGLLTGNCCRYIDTFDPKKSKNPFAYFTMVIINAFKMRIKKEKFQLHKDHVIKEEIYNEFLDDFKLVEKKRDALNDEDIEDWIWNETDEFEPMLEDIDLKVNGEDIPPVLDDIEDESTPM